MIYKNKKIPFPAKTLISFSKLIQQLEQRSSTGLHDDKKINELIDACKKDHRIINGFEDVKSISDNEMVSILCSTLFPDALRNNEIKGVIPPFEFRPFYLSDRFKKILSASGSTFSFELTDFDEDQMYIFGCSTILQFYYGYPFQMTLPKIVTIPAGNGKEKTYRLLMNGDLLEIAPAGKVPDFKETDWQELLNDFDNISLWKQKFPPDRWIMKGIGLVTLFDISMDQAIAKIRSRLLTSPLISLDELLPEMGHFLGVEDLKMGFLDHGGEEFATGLSGFSSIILTKGSSLNFRQNLCAPSYQKLIVEENPIVITDVEKWNQSSSCSTVSIMVEHAAAGSYLIVPVKNQNELLGYIELASAIPYKLNGASLLKLNVLMPTLAMAISKNRNELRNKIEALIQRKCTSIHSSVKWRFEEESIRYLENMDMEEDELEFNDIVFPEVYPLYGQLDISSSTKKRNEAVKADLLKQINYVDEILSKIWSRATTPLQEEILYRLHNFQASLQDTLSSDSEQNINYFLVNEIHPLLKLESGQGITAKLIDQYFDLLHPDSQSLYEKRKQYDKHVGIINHTLVKRLDKKQVMAQKMFPHYFERYRTDGVEFNMYIGQSICPHKSFSSKDLENLQLWQLMSICELERDYHYLKNRKGIELEITSLVLVYNTPITIIFRMDEKLFDVEGAYNARYEIIKKRIDKAYIKGTTERITCPGKITVIYVNDQDAVYYKRYISFLQSKELITKEVAEEFEVEDLPGVSGLKALRAGINYEVVAT